MRYESGGGFFRPLLKKALPRAFGAGQPDRGDGNPWAGHGRKDRAAQVQPDRPAGWRRWLRFPARRPRILLFAVPAFVIAGAMFMRDGLADKGFLPRAGLGLMEAGRLDRRLAALEERVKSDPNDIQAYFESGLLKFQKGPAGYIDAISDLETARSRGMADVRIFYYLGRMYQAVGLYDFALDEYRRFLNNRPDDFEVRMLTAKLFYSAGKYPQAVREYEALNVERDGDPLILENLALARWKNKQDPGPVLDSLLELGGEAAFRAGYVSGRMAYESKNYAAAVPPLEKAAASAPEFPAFSDLALVYRMLGDACMKTRNETGAIAALNGLLRLEPGDAEARSQLSRLMKAQAKKKPESRARKSTK